MQTYGYICSVPCANIIEVYFSFLYARDDQAELTAEQTKRINRITEQIEAGMLVLNLLGYEFSE